MIKVLYVEDELNLAMIVTDSLEDSGFEVFHRANGLEALAVFKHNKPDVIVMDIMMPMMDGYSLANEIRRIDVQVPIIFLSALTQTEDVVKGFHVGANDYIRKPFKVEELIVRIESFTKRAMRSAPMIYQIGDYVLDTNRNQLTYGSVSEKLSFRETELIRRLFENKEVVVPREEIIKTYWKDDTYFTGRSLDVFISRIRKYFIKDERIRITNVRGVGYVMKIS